MEFKLISEDSPSNFNHVLSTHIDKGWEVYGDLKVNQISGKRVYTNETQYSIMLKKQK